MARMGKNELARYEGANWFYRLIKEKGFEAAEQELIYRNAIGCPLHIEHSEVINFEQRIKAHTIKTICCLATLTLHDEFDFETEECARFINRFNRKADGLVDEVTSWADYAQVLRDELNIDVDEAREFEAEEDQLREEWRKDKLEGHC